jgi:hypothetical protein
MSPPRLAIAVLLLAAALPAADQPVLGDSGLPVAAAEAVLPDGALLHVRLGALGRTLERLDGLVMAFVPEKAVPPNMAPLLAQPHPLLAFIGQQMVGAPIDAGVIAQLSGLAAERPLCLTAYLGARGGIDWVLSAPIADRAAFSGLLVNLLRPRRFAAAQFGERRGWAVEGGNPDLPERLAILTSADMAYCCTSPALATRLAKAKGRHLADDPIAALLQPDADLEVLVDAMAVRPVVAQVLGGLAKQGAIVIADVRREALRGIPAEQMASLTLQLRLYTGMGSIAEALDYAQCLALAGVETAVPALSASLLGIDGLALSLHLRPGAVSGSVTLLADGADGLAGQALPLDEVRRAVAALPGERLLLVAEARNRPAEPGHLAADWLDLAVRKLAALGRTSPFLAGAAAYARECEPVPEPLDSLPWMLTASTQMPTPPPRNVGLEAWLAAAQRTITVVPDLQVFPAQAPGAVARLFGERAAAENRNAARLTRLLDGSIGDTRWGDNVARARSEARAGKAERLVYEDAWISRSGLLGYSQHELVNRIIAYTTTRDGLSWLQRVQGDGVCWLDGPAPAAATVPAALATLLAQVPAGSDAFATVRVLPVVARVVDGVDSLEQAVRHDLDAYLQRCEATINAHIGDEKAMMAALVADPLPPVVHTLNFDQQARTLYLVLAGGLRYPRPAVAPVLRRLLDGFLAKPDAEAGLVAWRRAGPRSVTIGFEQRTGAAALLVRSTGNALWQQFFANGDPVRRLQQVLGHHDDGAPIPPDEVLLFNPLWGQP